MRQILSFFMLFALLINVYSIDYDENIVEDNSTYGRIITENDETEKNDNNTPHNHFFPGIIGHITCYASQKFRTIKEIYTEGLVKCKSIYEKYVYGGFVQLSNIVMGKLLCGKAFNYDNNTKNLETKRTGYVESGNSCDLVDGSSLYISWDKKEHRSIGTNTINVDSAKKKISFQFVSKPFIAAIILLKAILSMVKTKVVVPIMYYVTTFRILFTFYSILFCYHTFRMAKKRQLYLYASEAQDITV